MLPLTDLWEDLSTPQCPKNNLNLRIKTEPSRLEALDFVKDPPKNNCALLESKNWQPIQTAKRWIG